MLHEILKEKPLFKGEMIEIDPKEAAKEAALDLIEDCVDPLILSMAVAEKLELFPREDIEEYVLSYIEAYEKRYYLLKEDDLDKMIRQMLWG